MNIVVSILSVKHYLTYKQVEPVLKIKMIKGECLQCNIKVKDLSQHTKRVHSRKPDPESELFCDECGRSCKNKNQLSLHWSYAHKVVEDLQCTVCNKPFQNVAKLRKHVKLCIAKHNNVEDDMQEKRC